MSDLEQFRAETRAWLEANCPEEMRQPLKSQADHCWGGRKWQFQSEEQKVWMERMADKGWTAPQWPKEYGGGGLGPEEAEVLAEEMKRINARTPVSNFGFWMLGPALLKFGSEELKRQHLPPICRGEIRWCQGYSEPNAGSDLASLQTRAEAPRTRATTSWSTAKRSGPPTRTRRTGFSVWCAPTPTPASTTASPSPCSIWRAKASAPARSS